MLVRCLSVVPTAAFEAEEAVEVAESGLEVLEAFTVPGLNTVERDFRFEAELRPDVAVVEGRKLIFHTKSYMKKKKVPRYLFPNNPLKTDGNVVVLDFICKVKEEQVRP